MYVAVGGMGLATAIETAISPAARTAHKGLFEYRVILHRSFPVLGTSKYYIPPYTSGMRFGRFFGVWMAGSTSTAPKSRARLARPCRSHLMVQPRAVPLALFWQTMDINKMLAELRAERDQLAEAILVLERLAAGQGKRRGRPPAWMTALKRLGRPPGSKNKPKAD